ncbi:MAG: protein arginine kinase [Chlamydiota bacterium]|nr:protein arginine kinase [Chlamydiota bacterium]
MMKKNNNSPTAFLADSNPWKNNDNTIRLASTISIFRNIEKFNFPGKLDTNKQKNIVQLIGDSLLKNPSLNDATLYNATSLGPTEKEYLSERFLSAEGFYQAHAGEAFVLDHTGNFLATINVDDHIHLEVIDTRGKLEKRWEQLIKIERDLGKFINYAYSQRFGFLTANPALAGTGMVAQIFLQLPALIHTDAIDDILNKISDEAISITGLHGSPTEIIGDILVVKNNYTLGVSEENILSSIEALTTKLTVEEQSTRKKIQGENNSEIKDRISRAYGILVHSYQIETIEALNALSLIKLGLQLDWIKGMTIEQLNELFFNCRRAHLLSHFSQDISQEDLAHKRAEFIHESLKNVKLTM